MQIELDVDQMEQVGIAYIKQSYELLREQIHDYQETYVDPTPSDDDKGKLLAFETVIRYVLPYDTAIEYLMEVSQDTPIQTSLSFT